MLADLQQNESCVISGHVGERSCMTIFRSIVPLPSVHLLSDGTGRYVTRSEATCNTQSKFLKTAFLTAWFFLHKKRTLPIKQVGPRLPPCSQEHSLGSLRTYCYFEDDLKAFFFLSPFLPPFPPSRLSVWRWHLSRLWCGSASCLHRLNPGKLSPLQSRQVKVGIWRGTATQKHTAQRIPFKRALWGILTRYITNTWTRD